MKQCILRIFAVVCAVLVIPSQIRADCTNAPAGIVSWWAGEGSGSDSIGNNPATVSSGVSYGAGEVGQAFNFDGSNANLVIPASASLNVGTNGGFTIEGWIKPTDVSGMHMLFEWSDGANFGVHLTHSQSWFGSGGGPGNLLANIVDSGGGWHPLFSAPGFLTTNSFQHIAMTYDKASGVGRLYVNGAVIASDNLGSFTPETSYTLHVGKRPWDPNFPLYGGLLDEVSLYSRALSQGELQAIYFAGSSGKCQAAAPFIASQPQDQNVAVGATATFSVTAGGSPPLSYQWRFNNTDVSGATDSTLTINNAQVSDGGNYAVVVANPIGIVTSAVAVLTVHEIAPFIVSQPQDQNVAVGASASFSVSAGGSPPLSYQWRFNNTDVSGATDSTLTINNAQVSDGGNYAVVVANPIGSVTSVAAVLTVHDAVCTNAPAGIVSWWAGEGNGSDTAGSNPATVSGGVSYGAGEVGQAFNFDGSNANLVIPASESLNVGTNSGFTIEGWIKPTDVSGMHMLFEWSDGANFGVHLTHSQSWFGSGGGPGNLLANIVDSGGGWHPLFSPPGFLTTNSFQHIAMTYDKASGVGRLYVNGAVIANGNLGSFTPETSYTLHVGKRPWDPNFPLYGGLLDEVSLYSRALSQGELQAIYFAGSLGKCQGAAPFILTQPQDQNVVVGASASFSVSAGGSPPLSYQWRYNNTDVSGATDSTLTINNAQVSDGGNYAVVVANPLGFVTSSVAVLTVHNVVCTNAPMGIVSWWAGEGSGSDSIGSNPATVSSGVSYGAGEVGQAFNFDGSNANLVIPASASLNVGTNGGFTIEGWIKPTDVSGMHMLFEWSDGANFGVHLTHSQSWFDSGGGPGNLLANIVDSGGGWHPLFSAPGFLTTNSFQHIAMTYDKASGVGRLYVNGAVIASDNLGSFTPETSYTLHVGKRPWDPNFPLYGGLLDEVSLYSRALSQGELQAIYVAGSSGKCQAAAPFIVSQPQDQNVAVGASATFSVSAGGSPPLSYQWRYNNTDVSGATNSTLSINNAQLSDGGNYAVVVANPVGSVTSSVAVLTVHEAVCTNAPGGLVSWWAGEGNGSDTAGNNPATVSGGVSYGAGEVGQAFNFDGSNANLVIPASESLNVGTNSGFTIEGWIKPTDVSGMHMLFEWSDGNNFGVHLTHSQSWFGSGGGPGNLLANIVDSGGGWHPLWSPPGLLTTNSFQHIAMTYDNASGVGRLYVNGAVIASGNLGSFTPETSYTLHVGKRPWDPNFPLYGGLLDEVSLYSRALSQGELQAIYFAGSQGKCQGAAPFIVTQPQDQNVVVGASASFSVSAGGSAPLSYQWSFNGSDVSGATDSTLTINNAQVSDGGNYAVVVANPIGSVTSVAAVLTVHDAVCTNAPAGIVSWWAGEGNGSDTAGSNPATVSGGVSYGAGEVGQAFNFDGSNANLVIPASESLNVGTNSGFTIEGWIKPTDVSGMHMLFEWSDGANFGVHLTHSQSWFGSGGGPGNLLANIVDSGGGWHPLFSAPGFLTTNSFQHIAMTYDNASGVGRLYVNGAVIANGNLGSFTPETSYTLHVGKRPWDPNFPLYGGLLDEVSLYSRALSQGELQAIYFAGSAGKCQPSGPVATVRNKIHMLPIAAVAHGYKINFSATANQTYVIQRAPRLNGPWITVASVLVNANGIGSYVDTNAPSDAAFYRLVAQ